MRWSAHFDPRMPRAERAAAARQVKISTIIDHVVVEAENKSRIRPLRVRPLIYPERVPKAWGFSVYGGGPMRIRHMAILTWSQEFG